MTADKDTTSLDGDAIERLLGQADPRPSPPLEDERIVRDAVRAQWRVTTRSRRRRHRLTGLGMAAALVAAVSAGFTLLMAPAQLTEVARLDRSHGSVMLQSVAAVNDSGELSNTVFAGQVLTTRDDAGAGLTWGRGGSLRIDGSTHVEFLNQHEIMLHRGRVYFDSAAAAQAGALTIRTHHGIVTHAGTQFMTELDEREGRLVVSVREGQVTISGRYYDRSISEGQQALFVGRSPPSVVNISGAGEQWRWVEPVGPGFDVQGKSAYEFLQWVSRETGHALEFASPDAETIAREALLAGTVSADPRTELRLRMLTMDLDARLVSDRAVLVVRKTE